MGRTWSQKAFIGQEMKGRVFQIEEFVSRKKVQKGPVFLKIKKYFCVARCRVERWWEMREVGRVTSG